MLKRLRLRINNRLVAWTSVLGVGLIPCPDCGVPLAVHVWPVAGAVWLYRRFRRRSLQQIDLLLSEKGPEDAGQNATKRVSQIASRHDNV